jgi:DnaK suppressor protein
MRQRFADRDVNDVRIELQWKRNDLALRLERIRRDAMHRLRPLSADFSDRAQEVENDEVLERLEASTATLQRQYDHALARLDAGQYGVCEKCGDTIEPQRLEVMPQATTCLSCVRARALAA